VRRGHGRGVACTVDACDAKEGCLLAATSGFAFEGSHVYVGVDPLSTLAPGRFTSVAVAEGATGTVEHSVPGFDGEDLHFSVHAEACGQYGDGAPDEEQE
jgi:hypothetical protein